MSDTPFEMALCDKCDGTGFGYQHIAPWDGPSEPCAYCGGSGEVEVPDE